MRDLGHQPLWLRSLLGRPAGAGLLVLVMLTVAAAATGPMVLRAAEQAALRNAVTSAPAATTSIVVTDHTGATRTLSQAVTDIGEITSVSVQSGLFHPETITAETGDPVRAGAMFSARLVARSDGCRRFVVIQGHCPHGVGELLVATGSTAPGVGAVLLLGPTGVRFAIVGKYDPARSSVGVPSNAFAAGARLGPDLVLTVDGLARVAVPITVVGQSRLIASRAELDREPAVRAAVTKARAATLAQAASLTFDSGLPALLDRVDAERVAVRGLVLVVTAQVITLTLLAAAAAMATLARARSREWALSRLRAVRRPAWLGALYAEPGFVLIFGAMAGFALGVLTARLTALWVLAGTAIEPWRAPALGTVAVVIVGLAVALVATGVRSARAPLASLLHDGAEPERGSRLALVGETLVLALAAAAIYQLAVSSSLSGRSAGLALLAPGLISVALSMLAVRAAIGWARRSTRRAPRGMLGLLVWRRLARTPSHLRRDIVVAIGCAVAVFALQLVVLTARNDLFRAQAQVGAATVLHVRVPAGRSLLDIVRAADPSGTQAMAVAERAGPTDTGTSRIVAVDIVRLARISPWRPSWAGMDARQVARALHPPAPIPPVMLIGDRIEVTLDQVSVIPLGGLADSGTDADTFGPPAISLTWTVADRTGFHLITFRTLTTQAHPVQLTARLPCLHGCRLVQVAIAPTQAGVPYQSSFVLTRLQTSSQPATTFRRLLTNESAWQTGATTDAQQASPVIVPSATGLRVSLQDNAQTGGAFAPADVPIPLPAVLGRGVDATPIAGQPRTVPGAGLDDQQLPFHVVATAAVVPRALTNGVLVDLSDISALSDPGEWLARQEVWLTPGKHPAVEHALTTAGVTITGTDTVTAARAVITRTGPARAVLVNLALIVLAAVLAIAALVATQLISAAERRQLWGAAAIAGLPRRVIRRAVFFEIAVPACIGALLGAAAGWFAIVLAGHRLPLFAAHTVGPPLDTVPDRPLFAATAAIAVALMVLVAAISAALQSAAARRSAR